MDPFIGQITLFAGDFAPRGWAKCEGQLIPISQNTALFSILGTMYGGDGRTTFALPDLRGRVPISAGTGPGLSSYSQGEKAGTEGVALTPAQMPAHSHGLTGVNVAVNVSSKDGTVAVPVADSTLAGLVVPRTAGIAVYNDETPDVRLHPGTGILSGDTDNAGAGGAIPVVQPFLALNYIIALVGVFPSRN